MVRMRWSLLRSALPRLAFAGLFLVCALILARDRFWVGELLASLDWYAGWAAVGVGGALWLVGGRRLALAALLLALWLLGPEAALHWPGSRGDAQGRPTLLVASINLLEMNRSARDLRELLARERPDVVAFQEQSPFWRQVLESEPLASAYPHRLAWPDPPRTSPFGLMIASRLPFVSTRVLDNSEWLPFLEVVLEHDGVPFHLVDAHPPRPGRAWRIEVRNARLAALGRELDWGAHSVLLGDLNVSARSSAFADLLQQTGLRDSRAGFGRQASWRSGSLERLRPPLRVAIDHVLVGAEIGVSARWLGPDIGSDHLPVFARLHVR